MGCGASSKVGIPVPGGHPEVVLEFSPANPWILSRGPGGIPRIQPKLFPGLCKCRAAARAGRGQIRPGGPIPNPGSGRSVSRGCGPWQELLSGTAGSRDGGSPALHPEAPLVLPKSRLGGLGQGRSRGSSERGETLMLLNFRSPMANPKLDELWDFLSAL